MNLFFSIVFSTPEILSFISCILFVILVFVVPVHLPRFSISRIPLVCVFFITPISVFKSWPIYFTCLIVFSWFSWVSLNDLLISSNFLFVFSSVSLREFFCFLFKGLHHLHIVKFKDVFFFFCVRMIKSSCFVFAWFWCYHVVF